MTRAKSVKTTAAKQSKVKHQTISSMFAQAEKNIDTVQTQLRDKNGKSRTGERLLAIERSMLEDSDTEPGPSKTHNKPRKTKSGRAKKANKAGKVTKRAPRARKVRQTESEKLLALSECYQLTPSAEHTFELLEYYSKHHTLTCEPAVLRELLRMSHKFMTNGAPKSKIRGILGYFTRNPLMQTWMKTNQILAVTASLEHRNTFKSDIEIPFDRIVDQTTILRLRGNPHNQDKIQIMEAKVNRLKTTKSRTKNVNTRPQAVEAHEGTYEGMPGLGSLDNLFIE